VFELSPEHEHRAGEFERRLTPQRQSSSAAAAASRTRPSGSSIMDAFTDFGSSERAMEKERKERQEAARKKRAKEVGR
jgi:hypothetical protein